VDPFTDTGVIAARYNKVMAALQSVVANFQQLFDGSPQAVISTDLNGIITRVNRGFERTFGYRADHITGSHNCDMVVPEEMILEMTTIRQTILSGKSIHRETSRRHRSGKLIPVRSVDTVARLGGDEFAVLLEDISDSKEIIAIARRIRNESARVFRIQDNDVYISSSIGIVLNTAIYGKPEDILRDADIAMYRAKGTGKSRYKVFSRKLHGITHDAMELENDLKKAVEQNELVLYYQPVICSESKKIKGCEALVRWMHPTRGMVLPADFISLAEETSLIIPIGEWVIKEACRQLKVWQTTVEGAQNMSVSVNISSRQFMHNDLELTIRNALDAVDLSSHFFVAELTESSVMEKPESVIGQLKRLKKTGIKIAIDDFGTGYSSLAYLKRFPLDYLKMDKSFAADINLDHENLAIAKAIITLAHNLKLKVVADGIERIEELETLKGLHCDYVQGCFYSRPVTGEQMMQLIEKEGR